MKPLFNPSLMCMDLLNIKEQIEILNERADMYHVDIMDGHFVKNITLSPDFVKAISKVVKIPMDCHLMTILRAWRKPAPDIFVRMQRRLIQTPSGLSIKSVPMDVKSALF